MKRRIKNISIVLSAILCAITFITWGLAILGWRFYCATPHVGNLALELSLGRGAVGFVFIEVNGWELETGKKWDSVDGFKLEVLGWNDWEVESSRKIFMLPTFEIHGEEKFEWAHALFIPYWFFILCFAVPPALWFHRRYVERRDKKVFEQIKREKLGEGGDDSHHKDTKTPRV